MKKRLAGLLLAALVLVPSAASGEALEDVRDATDTRGKFDIREVEHYGGPRTWKIATWPRWSIAETWDRGYFLVRLDTFAGPRRDYYGLIRSTGLRLQGSLWRDFRVRRDRKLESLDTFRTSARNVKIRIPVRDLLGRKRNHYRWSVQSLWRGPSCEHNCFDFAPNWRFVRQPIS